MFQSSKCLYRFKYLTEGMNQHKNFNLHLCAFVLKPFNIRTVESGRYNLCTVPPYGESITINAKIQSSELSIVKNSKRYETNYSLLLSNGFTEVEAKHILHSVLDIMEMKEEKLMSSLINWRTLKIKESDLLNSLFFFPELILLEPKHVNERVTQLLTVFTNADVGRFIKHCPTVFIEDWDDLMKKVQFMVYSMGLEQPNIVRARALMYDLKTIQIRHQFLCLSGIYKKPKAKKPNKNPPLYKILEPELTVFLQLSGLSEEEYAVFSDIFINELELEEMSDDDT